MTAENIKLPKNQFELDVEAAIKEFEGQILSESLRILLKNKLDRILQRYKERGETIVDTLSQKEVLYFSVKIEYKLGRIITFPVTA
jgi:hypothetical protein